MDAVRLSSTRLPRFSLRVAASWVSAHWTQLCLVMWLDKDAGLKRPGNGGARPPNT